MNVISCHNGEVGGFKSDEEFGFDDIININFDESFKLSTVRLFQNIKISNIERCNDHCLCSGSLGVRRQVR